MEKLIQVILGLFLTWNFLKKKFFVENFRANLQFYYELRKKKALKKKSKRK